jgi:hypothetical protein
MRSLLVKRVSFAVIDARYLTKVPAWSMARLTGINEQEAEKVFRQLKAIDNPSNPKAE